MTIEGRLAALEKRDTLIIPDYSEIDELLTEETRKMNAPEARAERESRYQELIEVGKKRAAAFAAGLNMDEVAPLPEWVTCKPSEEEINRIKEIMKG